MPLPTSPCRVPTGLPRRRQQPVGERGVAGDAGVLACGQFGRLDLVAVADRLGGLAEVESGEERGLVRRLDQLVAGGLPYGVTLDDNLRKECYEEAGIGQALADLAVPAGLIRYRRMTQRGGKEDVLYVYDLELPRDFVPFNTDGEVEEFRLLPIDEVARIVRETDDFKSNCNLVIIDFLIRHGLLPPDHDDYLSLVSGLRCPEYFASNS